MYVCSTELTIRGTIAGGNETGLAAFSFRDGPAKSAVFKGVRSVDVNPWTGDVYLADAFNNRIRLLANVSDDSDTDVEMSTASATSLSRPVQVVEPMLDDAQYWASPATVHETRRRQLKSEAGSPHVMIWVGTCGVYHDHYLNGKILTAWINSGNGTAGAAHGGARWRATLERETSVFERLDELRVKAIVF